MTKSGKVTIPAGQTSAKVTPGFPVNGDTTLEENETFNVTLGTPEQTEVTLSASKIGTGTITNDDQVTVSINSVTDTEPTDGNARTSTSPSHSIRPPASTLSCLGPLRMLRLSMRTWRA